MNNFNQNPNRRPNGGQNGRPQGNPNNVQKRPPQRNPKQPPRANQPQQQPQNRRQSGLNTGNPYNNQRPPQPKQPRPKPPQERTLRTGTVTKNPRKRQLPIIPIAVVLAVLIVTVAVVGISLAVKSHKVTLETSTPKFVSTETGVDHTEELNYTRDQDEANFLVVGMDFASNNTDVMMLVNFNMKDFTLNILQLPRDTYFDGSRMNHWIIAEVGAIYMENPNTTVEQRRAEAIKRFADKISLNFCVQIDGYALIDLKGFRNCIDLIGGVDITLPADLKYSDPEQDLYIDLKAGPQTLDGEKAEHFVRYRKGYAMADIGRLDAQKVFLTALVKKIKNDIKLSDIPDLATEALKNVITNVEKLDMIYYSRMLQKVDLVNVSMVTLAGSSARRYGTSGASMYIINKASAVNTVNQFFNVYNQGITADMFDSEKVLCDFDSKSFMATYNLPAEDPGLEVKTTIEKGNIVDENGIDITMLPQ